MRLRSLLCIALTFCSASPVVAQPEAEGESERGLTVTGTIRDARTKLPIAARLDYELLPSRIIVATDSSDVSGNYSTLLPYLASYRLQVTSSHYFGITDRVNISKVTEEKTIVRDHLLTPIATGEGITLIGIEFKTGSAELLPGSTAAINDVYKLLSGAPQCRIEIQGHTDNVGENYANQKLSLERANAVMQKLIDRGIDSRQLSAIGHGENVPVASNDSEAGRKQNRRVEFWVIDCY